MATPDVFDFDTLLAPIPGDSPTGGNLRDDTSPTSLYYRIKGARDQARAVERQMMMAEPDEAAALQPDWSPIVTLVPDALAEQTKDLEITAWLIEALARSHGFAGLRDGFRLVRELCERFWDDLHPMPDEDGLEARLYALTGLNGEDATGTLIAPILAIPIVEGEPFGVSSYQQAAEVDRIEDKAKKQVRIARGAVSMEVFDRAKQESSDSFFLSLKEDIEASQEAYAAMTQLLEEKAGREAPPSSSIRNALQEVFDTLLAIARNVFDAAEGSESLPDEATADGAVVAAGDPGGGGGAGGLAVPQQAIANRQDAFNTLLKLADFFKRTEPHSPVSYALEKAVRWGKLPLPDLLGELIPDDNARDYYFKLTGVSPPSSEE